jgi:hypothetical protein
VLSRHWLPYSAMLPPLFALAARIGELSGPMQGAAWEKLKQSFWCSCFGQRYDGPPNTLAAMDLRQMTAWFGDANAPIPDAISGFRIDGIDLRRSERQRAALYRSVVCLTVVNGARDFHTGIALTAEALNDPSRRIEDHHLFPSGYLKRLSESRSPENSILNRALIDQMTNRRIADRAPSEYLREIEMALGEDVLESNSPGDKTTSRRKVAQEPS